MKEYNQHCFDEGYYEHGERAGFKNYSWETVKKEVKMKLNWIERWFKLVDSILFVGCAKGFEVREARDRGYRAYGVEPSEYALEHADNDIRQYLEFGDIRDLRTFSSNSVDLVCVFDVIHIVDMNSRKNAYAELNRVAMKGIVLRTRVLSPTGYANPESENTVDGDVTNRESLYSLIKSVEYFEKFKMFRTNLDQRYVAWCAFGREKTFKTTHKDMLER